MTDQEIREMIEAYDNCEYGVGEKELYDLYVDVSDEFEMYDMMHGYGDN